MVVPHRAHELARVSNYLTPSCAPPEYVGGDHGVPAAQRIPVTPVPPPHQSVRMIPMTPRYPPPRYPPHEQQGSKDSTESSEGGK